MKMNRFVFLTTFFCCIGWLPAQVGVGVNTLFPRGVFHIDGAGDNPQDFTTALTPGQASNDVIIDINGNVGIGTVSPVSGVKLDINGGIRIVDGTQGVDKVLTTTVGDGVASWQPVTVLDFRRGVLRDPAISITYGSSPATATDITVTPITVTPGRWLVFGSCAMAQPGAVIEDPRRGYAYLALRSSTGIEYNQIGFTQELYAGRVAYPSMNYILTTTTTVDLRLYAWHRSGQAFNAGYMIHANFWAIKLG